MDELTPQDAMLDDVGGDDVADPDLDVAPPEVVESDPAPSPWDVMGEPEPADAGPPPAPTGDVVDAPPPPPPEDGGLTDPQSPIPEMGGDPIELPAADTATDAAPTPWDVTGEPAPDSSLAPPPPEGDGTQAEAPPLPDGVEPDAGDQVPWQDPAAEEAPVDLPLGGAGELGEAPPLPDGVDPTLGDDPANNPVGAPLDMQPGGDGDVTLPDPDTESSIEVGAAGDLAAELGNGELSADALAELTGLAVDPDGDGISSVPVDALAAFLERHDLAGTATTATVDDVAAAVTAGTPVDVLATDDAGVHTLRIVAADQGVFTLEPPGGGERLTLSAPELGRGMEAAGNQVVRIPGRGGGLGEMDVPALDPASITPPEAAGPPADALAPIPGAGDDDSGLSGMAVAAVVLPLVVGGGYFAAKRLRT